MMNCPGSDTKKATSYLGSFATLVRKTLESSAHDHISIEDEIEYLESYLTLKKEELDDNLVYEITLINQELRSAYIPSMVLQPFLENVFVHAFTNKSELHRIHIIFESINSSYLSCTIADNGTGLSKDNKKNNHRSFASEAIERKLKLLQQLHFKNNIQSNITIQNNGDIGTALFSKGTTVKIILPVSSTTNK